MIQEEDSTAPHPAKVADCQAPAIQSMAYTAYPMVPYGHRQYSALTLAPQSEVTARSSVVGKAELDWTPGSASKEKS